MLTEEEKAAEKAQQQQLVEQIKERDRKLQEYAEVANTDMARWKPES